MDKFWTHLKLKNGDRVHFVPPAPDGDQLGGITQAERESIGDLLEDNAKQLNKPESGIAVGKYFRVASLDADGNPVLQAVDLPVAVNVGTGGIVKSDKSSYGVGVNDNGYLVTSKPGNATIDAKANNYLPLVSSNIERAVRAGLLSNNQITDADKPLICETIGAERKYGDWQLIETITLAENGTGFVRNAQPDGTVYNFKKIMVELKYLDRTGEMAISLAINTSQMIYTNSKSLIRMTFTGTNKGVALFKSYIENGMAFGEIVFTNNVSDNSPNNGTLNASTKYLTADVIYGVAITAYQANIIPAGSVFKIYAVRA